MVWTSALALAFLSLWVRHSGILPGDRPGALLLRALPEAIVRFFALVGGTAGIAGLALLLTWRYRRYVQPLTVLGAMLPIPVVEAAFKHLVGRPRPGGHGLGFPSGHAIASLSLVLLLAGYTWPELSEKQRSAFVLFSFIYILAVGVGRVAMGLHWPSDILGGWLLAVIYATGILHLRRPG